VSGGATEAAAALRAYAAGRGLMYFEHWSLPEATQLLHHGFMREVPSVAIGDLPGGLGQSWLAHAGFAFTTRSKIEHHYFTLVTVPVQASAGVAVRVLCHDRGLPEFDRSNPDVERETVELSDRPMSVESEAFLKRYVLSVDHDQDEVRAWQLFDPGLIDWLTRQAPPQFSFELQDGALAGFVPGMLTEAGALDALCVATARVRTRALELGDEPAAAARAIGAADPSRAEIIARALAAHPFDEPPKSVKSAARKFGGLHIEDAAWELGQEAFFRQHVAVLGLQPAAPGEFRAAHMTATIPGQVTQAAHGPIPHAGVDGWLLFTTDTDPAFQDVGWMVLLAELEPTDNGFAFSLLPAFTAAEREHDLTTSADWTSLLMWKPESPHGRTAEQLAEFLDLAGPLLGQAIAAAKGR
jgi:hypothetical protein